VEYPEKWYQKSKQDLQIGSEDSILERSGGYLSTALSRSFPEYSWIPWLFEKVPNGFWQSKENHLKFFEWAKEKLEIKKDDDWYLINGTELKKIGGNTLLTFIYHSNLYLALKETYTNLEFLPWKFVHSFADPWEDIHIREHFMIWITHELKIRSPEDWYRIGMDQLREYQSLFTNYYG
jgi:hypothetical protein